MLICLGNKFLAVSDNDKDQYVCMTYFFNLEISLDYSSENFASPKDRNNSVAIKQTFTCQVTFSVRIVIFEGTF